MINTKNFFQHTPIDLCFLNGHEGCMREQMEQKDRGNQKSQLKVNSILSMQDSLGVGSGVASFLLSPKALLNTSGMIVNNTSSMMSRPSEIIEDDLKMLKQLSMLKTSRKRIQNTYKIVLYLKEPLIKVNI